MYQKTVSSREEGQRFDKFLHKILPEAGNGFICKMLRRKNITLNDKKADACDKIKAGDIVKIYFADDTLAKFMGKKTENVYQNAYDSLKDKIHILFENEDILAADKPSGVLSQKAEPNDISVNEWLIGYMIDSGEMSEEELISFAPSVCNRLDRNTSGIILCGKTITGEQLLSEMLRSRTLDKFYIAAVLGKIESPKEISGYLIKDKKKNKVTVIKEAPDPDNDNTFEEASPIHTFYRPLYYDKSLDASLIEVKLLTGKTHQIRAHLSSECHPIIGDMKYGNERKNIYFRDRFGIRSQMLHCQKVIFPCDDRLKGASGKEIVSPAPSEFVRTFGSYVSF